MSYAVVLLKKGKIQSIERRHPWVFSGAINADVSQIEDGEKVNVADKNGKIAATGHFSTGSIAVRILAFADIDINEAFYLTKLGAARAVRALSGIGSQKDTNAYRLVHGEGDELPGLVIDYYNGVAVVQCHSAGMVADFKMIESALRNIYGDELKKVVFKSAVKNGDTSVTVDGENTVDIAEYGHKFRVNYETGQKTGFFLDQRENRALITSYSKGKKMLNAFCYSGGFSIYALQAGALEVHSLDSSAKAMKLLKENLALNGLDEVKHVSLQEDALAYLNSDKAKEAAYDIIILDPPAFAKHRSARHRAVQAYKRLNSRALEILKPGGLLLTFSCSQVVTPELFNHTIAAAAIDAGRHVRIMRHLHQPEDHPVSIFHPEGEYLKGLALAVK